MAWAPADHQHLDRLIATNSMAPVIALLEAHIRLEIHIRDLHARKPQVQLLERWRAGLAIQTFDQLGKGDRAAIGWFSSDGSFGIY